MRRTGTRVGWRAAMWALAAAAAVGCGGGSSPTPPPAGPPSAVPPGTPLGLATSALKIGPEGGSVTSSDGVFTVSLPAGAVSAEIDVTIEVITNTAPSAVGNAYRIVAVPPDTVFAAPVALVFTPPAGAPPVDTLTVATQDANGFWVRQQAVTRDATAGTLTVTTTTLGDWAIVGAPTGRDLIGVFHVESTAGAATGRVPVTADGRSALNFHAGDATTGWYVQSGQLIAASPFVSGGQTCAPATPTMRLAPNVAEILAAPEQFRWGIDGHWELACGGAFPPLAYLSVDTTGLQYLSCTRTYLEPPLVTPEKLLGSYLIDCGPEGTVSADWHFEICNQGEPCPSANPCHTASITCDTGLPLCVDDGNVPNGLLCDLDPTRYEVCGDGVCNVCRIDEACTPAAPDVCHLGKYTCDTGFEVCTDQVPVLGAAAFVPNGTACELDPAQPEVCGDGTCNVCYAGRACATNPNRCVAGTTSCATGFETCVDTATPIAAGTICDVNAAAPEVCNGSGACVECWADLACSTNVNECVAGITSCATGGQTCENTATAIANGTACDDNALPNDEVCFNGVCSLCTAGNACATNPNECVAGTTSCSTGQEVCVDTTTQIANGTACVLDATPTAPAVCNGGVCNACTAGLACSTNPNNCVAGTTSCTTGVETCVDTATPIAAGTTCGTNMVCTGAGVCIACTADLACTDNSNECVTGLTSCATGGRTCENTTTAIPNGAACDDNGLPSDEVCRDGACSLCTAGLACSDNPNPCVDGVTSCATGTQQCVDTGTLKPNGTTCDLNPAVPEVCNGGTCNACTAGLACASNPNPCVAGVTSCATGTQQCIDTATPIAAGTACNVDPLADEVCNGTGACVACTAGLACTGNANECVTGVTSCATGGETCVNTSTAVANGTLCDDVAGVDEVCLNGVCGACTASLSCATNPDPLCHDGVTSCATGSSVCLDAAAKPNGTACGTNMVCNGGTCSACTAGLACASNPDPLCNVGVTDCSTGVSVCLDAAARPDGTACGADQVCSAGTCTTCVAGLSCTTNPDPQCHDGVTSCATGTSLCVDAAAKANGTTCDTNGVPSDEVCNAGACGACTAGLACSTNPDPCLGGVTSCATGVSECVDDAAAPEPNGTSCGADLVCSGGTCTSCTAGLTCLTNPDPCLTGVTSCATGTSVCADNATVPEPNGTSCGSNLVCNGGSCTSCVAGLACTGNPSACLAGITSCLTGTQTCVDTAAAVAAGTTCDVNPSVPEVCSGTGTCVACTADLACDTNPNPCVVGATSCATGAQTCADTATPEANGTTCDVNASVPEVCNGGTCTACTAGLACSTNPNPCVAGTTSCATGTQTCVDTATLLANGTTCDVNPSVPEVCNGGTCSACTAGLACSTNPDRCFTGVTSCSTGVEACVDATQLPAGTSCGTNLVCTAAGVCAACTAGVACTTNPSQCFEGVTSCATGTSVCVDTVAKTDGTTCDTNGVPDDEVCSGGACGTCIAGVACTANPNECVVGTTFCGSGSQECIDTATPVANGTTCDELAGVAEVCYAGTCSACAAGLACSTNPNPCLVGTTSCATGTQTCVDTATARPNGTTCDVNPSLPEVCSGGTCSACAAGLSCATNPSSACTYGVTSCATGTETCVDGAAKPAGTSCGTNQVCSATASCVSCTEGLACDTNLDACLAGVTSCDTGAQLCVDDVTAPEPNGTVCGDGAVCSGGVCGACVAGLACDTNPTECVAGVTSCATGTSECVDSAAFLANGTTCDLDPGAAEVCNAGVCTPCTAGIACATNSNPCVNGVTSCATGVETCENGTVLDPDGTTCGTNLVCSGGACTSCTAGLACTTNSNPCVNGVTSCATGVQTCEDGTVLDPAGTSCGTNLVCTAAGACAACTAGLACTTNPNSCLAGVTSCATGAQTCVDSATPIAAGTACDVNASVPEVCSGTGTCIACTAGVACTTNPNAACTWGVTSCATGAETCVDGAAKPAGTSCGTDLVCSAAAACVSCTAGLACGTNPDPCLGGVTSCSTGVQTCLDDPLAREADGTTCDTNGVANDQVCSSGVCSTCISGVACSTNPTECETGVTSCATGTSLCVDSGTAEPNGAACDVTPSVSEVCYAGTCSPCTAGLACDTNSDPCVGGITSCTTGVQTCVNDPAAPEPNGTLCGTNLVCNAGSCTSCTADVACATNPNRCVAGTTSCATGVQTCADTATPVAAGTACDVNPSVPEVCSGSGTCVACTAGLACDTNPNACLVGTTSCATGAQTCVDTAAAEANGTSCGTNMVCSAGTCSSCTAGLACNTNPNVCVQGVTSCATGTQACVDGTVPTANGTVCGTNQVCSAGTCVACTAGLSCTTNPNPCVAGVTSCTTGTQACVDTATAIAAGTACDLTPSVPEVCSGTGTCVACTAGEACDTNAAPCLTGVTSCSTGARTCVDAATAEPDGTPCDVNASVSEVCSAGACVACTAGEACTPANPCHVGTRTCTSGPACADTGALLADGATCGDALSCLAGTCVSSRTVSGTRMATYWTAGAGCTAAAPCRSTVVAPDVVSGTAHVEALFPDGAGGWVRYPAAGPLAISLDGSFAIPNVPTGAYRLVLYDGAGVAHVVDTSSSSVDLGYDVLGRAGVALATVATDVTFQLTGLTNWLGDDEVQATAFDADVWDAPVSGNEIVTNQTTGTVVEDWATSSVGRPLGLLAAGDALHLHHLATATVTVGSRNNRVSYAYQRTTVARAVSGYALSDGQPTTIPVALAAVTSTGSITVDWDPEPFEALLPQLGPSPAAATNAHRVDVEAAPYASLSAAPVGAWGSPQLFRIVRAAGGATVLARITLPAITYGRFLDPALASEWWRADYTALQSYTAPGATAPLQVRASVGRRGVMTSPLPAPIVPAIGPVRTPTITPAGTATPAGALGTIPPVGETPTLAWTAPATGTPSRYEVRIHRLDVGAGGATVSTPVAAFRQPGASTSLVIPPGLLEAGVTYYAEIAPHVIASDRFDLAPLRLVQVFSHATTLTAPFTR